MEILVPLRSQNKRAIIYLLNSVRDKSDQTAPSNALALAGRYTHHSHSPYGLEFHHEACGLAAEQSFEYASKKDRVKPHFLANLTSVIFISVKIKSIK